MKNTSLFVVLALLTATAAQADWSCSNIVKNTVANQAQIDFPDQSLIVVVPAFDFDGGRVQSLNVPVQNDAGQVVATYNLQIDEVCSVELQPLTK